MSSVIENLRSEPDQTPRTLADLERNAQATMHPIAWDFYSNGAEQGETLATNRTPFRKYKILPQNLMRDVSTIDTRTRLLTNFELAAPIGLSPTAMHAYAHEDGELATARAVQSRRVVQIVSGWPNYSMEQIRKAAPTAILWQNTFEKKSKTMEMIKMAEDNEFGALVVSCDINGLSRRNYGSLLDLFHKYPVPYYKDLEEMEECKAGALYATWDYFRWVVENCKLPVVAKGILTPQAATLALANGASAIIVSNHGGRQLDGVPSTIDVLPSIVRAVGGKCEIYLDSGVRSGTDIFRALALGANAVFLGRPQLWGLAHGGQSGVELMLDIVHKELQRCMQLSGINKLSQITNECVIHENELAHL